MQKVTPEVTQEVMQVAMQGVIQGVMQEVTLCVTAEVSEVKPLAVLEMHYQRTLSETSLFLH